MNYAEALPPSRRRLLLKKVNFSGIDLLVDLMSLQLLRCLPLCHKV